jgi:hypothetical protein
MTASRLGLVVATAAAVAGCAAAHAPRFANAPAVTVVDDRRDVPVRPRERMFYPDLYDFDATFHRRITRALELERPRRALGVNALDEVPDSTWFINRIGIRALTPDEIRTGPLRHDSPEHHKPWTIVSTKIGGTSLGLIIKDARGERYLLKFDMKGFPEIETASDVIVNRLLWACGYNVAEDQIVAFRRDDLVLPSDAKIAGRYGDSHRLDRAELDRELDQVEAMADGRIRGLASRWLDGKPVGGHPGEGVRDDDPNDRIPHQLRRDLRGSVAIFAWLDHLDVKEANSLDMWVADPADAGRHYVKHFLVDFGRSLGAGAMFGSNLRAGFSYAVDFADIGVSLLSLGLAERTWEQRRAPRLRGLGLYDATTYRPDDWKPTYPAYVPILTADRFDKFWSAKIIMRFTREQLHAAVEAGMLTDPRSVAYLTDTLVARQRATASYWFERVNPLDHVRIVDAALAFDDLALVYGLVPDADTTRYVVTTYDRDGHVLGAPATLRAAPTGAGTMPQPALAPDGDGYTVVRIETRRAHFAGATDVHLARDPVTGAPRVIGIVRR